MTRPCMQTALWPDLIDDQHNILETYVRLKKMNQEYASECHFITGTGYSVWNFEAAQKYSLNPIV